MLLESCRKRERLRFRSFESLSSHCRTCSPKRIESIHAVATDKLRAQLS